MNILSPHSRRLLLVLGVCLCVGGVLLYGLDRTNKRSQRVLQQAEHLYQAQQYQEAIAAYSYVLQHVERLDVRLSALVLSPLISPARVSLQIANCRYRLAEAALHRYQTANKSRAPSRPSIESVQRLLTVAGKAYEDVPHTDPRASMAARVNAVRVQAWQLILAAFDEQTTGRRSLRQQALQAIRRAAEAVDFGYDHAAHLSRREQMTALLLLETLTDFSQETPPPSVAVSSAQALRGRLGDLLLKDTPELSKQERERFRQFFFALSLEAKDPWPTSRQGGAGGGRRRTAH